MSDWLESVREEQTAKISKLKPRRGNFVQLNSWFGDVWAEVKSHYSSSIGKHYESVTIYDSRSRHGWDVVYLHNIRRVSKILPKGIHILELREGRFGGREGRPFAEIPKARLDKSDRYGKL